MLGAALAFEPALLHDLLESVIKLDEKTFDGFAS